MCARAAHLRAPFAPIAGNDAERGRKLNRRIEIVMLPNIDELTVLDEPKDAKMP